MSSLGNSVNTKDKQLLILLLLLVIAFACYYFFISTFLDKGAILKDEAVALKIQVEDAKTIVANLPEIEKEEEQQREALLEKYKPFFHELNSERLLYQFDTIMAATGLQATAYSSSGFTAAPISIEKSNYQLPSYPLQDLASKSNETLANKNETSNKAEEPEVSESTDQTSLDSVLNNELRFQFSGTGYYNIMSFLKSVENMNKTIIPKNIRIAKSTNGAGLDGEIILGLYALPKVGDKEASYLEFKPAIPKGKPDPFQ